jgi:kynureninase
VGNSLGAQPKATRSYIEEELQNWEDNGVEGHFSPGVARPWVSIHENLTAPMARIVGAKDHEVVCMNQLTVNLHLAMTSFYRPTAGRSKVLVEDQAFPSDRFAVASQISEKGFDPATAYLAMKPRPGEKTLRTEDILARIEEEGDSIALVMLSAVQYYTGQWFDMKAITAAGHAKGCRVGFDCAHAVGNVPLQLHDWDVDFAVWCSYKYLNAGPGGLAGMFVHEKFKDDVTLQRHAGWWGHNKETRFDMDGEFQALSGAEGWQLSNPPVFQCASLLASLALFDQATMPKLRAKSLLLTSYMQLLGEEVLVGKGLGVHLITPRDSKDRGCQISVALEEGVEEVNDNLRDNGFLCDLRKPDVIRVAPVPLYSNFQDVRKFVFGLDSILLKRQSEKKAKM